MSNSMSTRLKYEILKRLGAWHRIDVLQCSDMTQYYEVMINRARYCVKLEDIHLNNVEDIADIIVKRYKAGKLSGLIREEDL